MCRSIACALIVILATVLGGCESRFREFQIAALETDPDLGEAPIVGVELAGNVQLEPAGPDAGARWRDELPPAERDRAVYVAAPATAEHPVIACDLRQVHTGGGLSWISMGAGRSVGVPMSGGYTTKHVASRLLLCDEILPVEDALLCRVANCRLGPEYYARIAGHETLVAGRGLALHPGFAPIGTDFWVVVPRRHAVSVKLPEDPTAFADDLRPALRRRPPPRLALPNPEGRGYAELRDDLLRRLERPLTVAEPAPEDLMDRCVAHSELVALGAHLIEQGHEEEVIAGLSALADGGPGGEYWMQHQGLYPHETMLLLLHVARGDHDAAVQRAGAVLHLRTPGWTFPREPHLNVAPRGGFAPLVRAVGAEVAANWPQFLARLAQVAPTAVTTGSATAGTLATATEAELQDRGLDELLDRLERGGPFVDPGLEAAIESAYLRAVTADPRAVEARQRYVDYCCWNWRGPRTSVLEGGRVAEELVALDPVAGHAARAELLAADGDLATAEAELSASAALAPTDLSWAMRRGDLYREAGDHAAACRRYAAVADSLPGGAEANLEFAACAVRGRVDLEEGIRRTERYLSLDPGPDESSLAAAEAWLGALWELRGDFQQAQAAFERSLQHDPRCWPARQALGSLEIYRSNRKPG